MLELFARLSCVLLLLVIILSVVRHDRRSRDFRVRSGGRPLPPGPRRLPIIGNMLDIPHVQPWLGYKKLSDQYGKIMSLEVLGYRVVVIDDVKIAIDLLEKRSSIHSSRIQSTVLELCGWAWNFSFMAYGSEWRAHRRNFWQHFHPGIINKYNPLQVEGSRRLLVRLLETPNELVGNVRYSIGETLLKTTYGLKVAPKGDKIIETFEEALTSLDLLFSGTSLVELLPWLKNVPTWLPGTGTLRRLAHHRIAATAVREMPWIDTKRAMSTGQGAESIGSSMFEKLSHVQGEDVVAQEEEVKSVLASIYSGGIDTTHASICSFVVAMSLNPEVQKRGQAELDAVIGPNRLPDFSDRESLPYINALVKETIRWHNPAPLGAHINVADDEYEGYFIPANSNVMFNTWSFMHDPERYPEPERFMPERFLKDGKPNPDVTDPTTITFGFGRRICPGRYFAQDVLFINIASILHTLQITPPVDDAGRPIQITPNATTTIVSHIEDCRCTIRPRSAAAEALIRGIDFEH